jgi:hypothetical protein
MTTSSIASREAARLMVGACLVDAALDDIRHRLAVLDAALTTQELITLATELHEAHTNAGPERRHGVFFIVKILSGRDVESVRRLRRLRINGPMHSVAESVWAHHMRTAQVVFEMTGKWP